MIYATAFGNNKFYGYENVERREGQG